MRGEDDIPFDDGEALNTLPIVRLQPVERREHLRLSAEALPGLMFIGSHKQVVMIRDISLTGAKIVNVPLDLKEGDLFELRVCLDCGSALAVRCSVMHAQGTAAWRTVGVLFVNTSEAEAERLLSYLGILGMKILR